MHLLRSERRLEKLAGVFATPRLSVLNMHAPLRAEFTSSKIIAALGIFWIFAAFMAALAGGTLIWGGTPLDRIWALNKSAYAVLSPIARVVGPIFLVFSAIMVCIIVGWFRRKRWAWWLAIGVLGTQVIGNVVNLARGDFSRGSAGVVIAGALLFLVVQREVRDQFS